jgi:hypothetical protein
MVRSTACATAYRCGPGQASATLPAQRASYDACPCEGARRTHPSGAWLELPSSGQVPHFWTRASGAALPAASLNRPSCGRVPSRQGERAGTPDPLPSNPAACRPILEKGQELVWITRAIGRFQEGLALMMRAGALLTA